MAFRVEHHQRIGLETAMEDIDLALIVDRDRGDTPNVKGRAKLDQCGAGKIDQFGVERRRRNGPANDGAGVWR